MDVDKDIQYIKESLTKLYERVDVYATVYVPRNEINLMQKNSDNARHELAVKVTHIENEVATVKKDMLALKDQISGVSLAVSNLKTTLGVYGSIAVIALSFLMPIITKIINSFF